MNKWGKAFNYNHGDLVVMTTRSYWGIFVANVISVTTLP